MKASELVDKLWQSREPLDTDLRQPMTALQAGAIVGMLIALEKTPLGALRWMVASEEGAPDTDSDACTFLKAAARVKALSEAE